MAYLTGRSGRGWWQGDERGGFFRGILPGGSAVARHADGEEDGRISHEWIPPDIRCLGGKESRDNLIILPSNGSDHFSLLHTSLSVSPFFPILIRIGILSHHGALRGYRIASAGCGHHRLVKGMMRKRVASRLSGRSAAKNIASDTRSGIQGISLVHQNRAHVPYLAVPEDDRSSPFLMAGFAIMPVFTHFTSNDNAV